MQALSSLAVSHRLLLSQYSSYLANVLDHLEGFTNRQLQQVFGMFAALTAVQPAEAGSQAAAAGDAATIGNTCCVVSWDYHGTCEQQECMLQVAMTC